MARTTKVEKKEVEKKVEATPVVEVKEEVKAEVKTEAKAEEAKAPAKKAAAKKTTTTAKKATTTKKTTTAKAAAEEKIVLQLGFGEYTTADIVAMCKKAYEAENKTKIKNIDVYVKPEDKKAYYVVNDKVAGAVEL